jgi:plastocyanin
MEETLFYVLGGALVVVALAASAVGLRAETFPPSRGALSAGLAVFAGLVLATTTFAVLNARKEQKDRRAEQAEEATAQEEEPPAAPSGPATTLKITAPADGSLAFDPDKLEAKAGTVTIEFTNPAAVQHDVVIDDDGTELARGDLIADGATSDATADLDPGEYVYYCSVTGHREAGMEGTLTVD